MMRVSLLSLLLAAAGLTSLAGCRQEQPDLGDLLSQQLAEVQQGDRWEIDLRGGPVDDALLARMKGHAGIEKVTIEQSVLTDRGFQILADLPDLQQLVLRGEAIDDDGLGILCKASGLLVLNLPFAPLWAKLLTIPKEYLYAGIAMFACFGVYAASAAMIDVVFMLVLGLIAFAMRRYGVPIAPVLIAVILGPLAESSLRSAMNNSQNNPLTLVSTPITITLYALLLIVIGISVYNKLRVRSELQGSASESGADAEVR